MGVLIALQQSNWTWSQRIKYLIYTCALFGILGIAIACVIDRVWYGFWAIPFLGSFHFNVILSNATLYGSHPWHWYLTVGIPVITGLLFPFVIWDFFLSISNLCSTARMNIWVIIAVYSFFHSFSGHKEFRFLLPILPLFCLVAGSNVQAFTIYLTASEQSQQSASRGIPLRAGLVIAVPNMLALLYLGLFHQSAPITVNHKIAEIVNASSSSQRLIQQVEQPRIYSVHYLTGGCHSTPLHSFLHVPDRSVVFDTWALDCSPGCRSDPDDTCEADQFRKDPSAFVDQAYSRESASCLVGDIGTDQASETCTASADRNPELPAPRVKLHPDFVVTFIEYTQQIQSHLSVLGLKEIARYPQGINGLRIGSFLQTGDGYNSEGKDELSPFFRKIPLLGDFLEITLDEMVLYASQDVL